jgi:hypothetical protein
VPDFGGDCGNVGIAGDIGCGEVAPEPVVVRGLMGDGDALPVVVGGFNVLGETLFAVLLLPFQPATTRNATSKITAMPAIQPHVPLTPSSRRSTGSLNRGSVKRGSLMAILLRFQTGIPASK